MSARRTAIAALLTALVLSACTPEEDREPSPVVSAPATSTGGASTVTTAATATTATTAAATGAIRVTVAAGKVTGGGRHKVARGSTVTLVVTADVSDEVHVHGYDLKADVTPSTPATLTFTASIAGIFEVELEKAHEELAELEVR